MIYGLTLGIISLIGVRSHIILLFIAEEIGFYGPVSLPLHLKGLLDCAFM